MQSEEIENIRKIAIATPSVGEEEWQSLREPLMSGWLTQGPKVTEFESTFAHMHHLDHALATTSCTTALHLALSAIGIGPGDEVIVPAFTWIATANVVLHCGATPILCDVDRSTYNIDINQIKAKITKRTKAIIPVHLFGLCADIDAIRSMLPSHVKIIEDAACAAGASYKSRFAGSLGDMGAFSFHPRKSITCGEGGMLTTNHYSLYEQSEKMRNHGSEISEEARHHGPKPHILPDFKVLGFNYRMTDLQACVGLVQLKKLNSFIAERQKWANFFTAQLKDVTWLKPQAIPSYITQHSWQAYVCFVDPETCPMPRNDIMNHLQTVGISTRPGTHALHMLTYYREKYNFCPEDFPEAQACDQQTMAIPLHNRMTPEDFEYIVSSIKAI